MKAIIGEKKTGQPNMPNFYEKWRNYKWWSISVASSLKRGCLTSNYDVQNTNIHPEKNVFLARVESWKVCLYRWEALFKQLNKSLHCPLHVSSFPIHIHVLQLRRQSITVLQSQAHSLQCKMAHRKQRDYSYTFFYLKERKIMFKSVTKVWFNNLLMFIMKRSEVFLPDRVGQVQGHLVSHM